MTTMMNEIDAKRAAEVQDMVARIMRQMADMIVEQKRLVVAEVDRLVAYEESTEAVAAGQRH